MFGKKAFTLIELLVVIAIIALLLSIILPSLKTVKEMAGASVCVSNQRQIMTAWRLYAEDNDSEMCSSNTFSYNPANGMYDWVEGTISTTTFEEEINGFDATDNQGITGGALYPYYEAPKLVHCPTDKRYLKAPTNTGFTGDGAYRTYSFVNGLNGFGWEDEPFKKITEVKNSSGTYALVEENDNRGWNWGTWVMNHPDSPSDYPRFADAFAVFHNMRSTIGFVDGHAEKVVWKNKKTEAFSDDISNGDGGFGALAEARGYNLDNEDLWWLEQHYPKK